MPTPNRAAALVTEARRSPDPARRLVDLDVLEGELAEALGQARAHKRAAILELKAQRPDLSNGDVGALIGVTGERVRQMTADA